jgi:ketosteroid isomerase-like protein
MSTPGRIEVGAAGSDESDWRKGEPRGYAGEVSSRYDARYDEWVRRYVDAWNTNDPAEIGALFTEDARYLTEPYAEPWSGTGEIVTGWLDHKDEPGDTTFEYEVIVATDDIGIVKGHTVYRTSGREYSNLWEVRLDEAGRCREFVEWWMLLPKGPKGPETT